MLSGRRHNRPDLDAPPTADDFPGIGALVMALHPDQQRTDRSSGLRGNIGIVSTCRRGGHVRDVDVVFDGKRHAIERTRDVGGLQLRQHLRDRLLQRRRQGRDDRLRSRVRGAAVPSPLGSFGLAGFSRARLTAGSSTSRNRQPWVLPPLGARIAALGDSVQSQMRP